MKTEKSSVDVKKLFEDFTKSLTAINEMTVILGVDCQEHYEAIQKGGSQSHRRAYVRAVFAFIEGVLHSTKESAAHVGFILGTLNLRELIVLDGTSLDVDENGEVSTRPLYPKFLNNLKFTFKVFAKSIGSTFALDLKHPGYQSLHTAVKIRDRLMHPKVVAELIVTDAEVAQAKKAMDWFMFNQALSGLYAQKAVSAKTTAPPADITAVDEQITFYEAELAKRK